MRRPFLMIGLSFAACFCVFGQISSNAFTVSASRNIYLQPDQAVFTVTVSAPATATLDQIVAAVQSAGITAANLTDAENGTWYFNIPVALTKMQATIASLVAVQRTVSKT